MAGRLIFLLKPSASQQHTPMSHPPTFGWNPSQQRGCKILNQLALLPGCTVFWLLAAGYLLPACNNHVFDLRPSRPIPKPTPSFPAHSLSLGGVWWLPASVHFATSIDCLGFPITFICCSKGARHRLCSSTCSHDDEGSEGKRTRLSLHLAHSGTTEGRWSVSK